MREGRGGGGWLPSQRFVFQICTVSQHSSSEQMLKEDYSFIYLFSETERSFEKRGPSVAVLLQTLIYVSWQMNQKVR